MPILNIELIKKAVKKISKVKEVINIKKGQTYNIDANRVVVKSFEGNNVHLNIITSSLSSSGIEIVTTKENLIQAIRDKNIDVIRRNRFDNNILKKRLEEVTDRSKEEAIANSPTVNKAKSPITSSD